MKRLVVLNEVLLLILVYFHLVFSHLSSLMRVKYLQMKFDLGYWYLGSIGVLVAVNLAYLTYTIIVHVI